MSKVRIAVDCMGGDNAPTEIVKGCVEALKTGDDTLVLVGKSGIINSELSKYKYDKERIEIVDAPEVIENDEIPTNAIRRKKNSSMVLGLNLVKEGKANAFISAGNTGALLAGATVIVGRIKGVERPCLATLIPTEKGPSLLMDVGANTDCKPNYIVQFAKMGSVYFENVMGVKNPKVGIVNIGVEEEKGNLMTREAHKLLNETDLNFIGNAEARDLLTHVADVLVCDGFVGNIILKFGEGMATTLFRMVKNSLMSSFIAKIGAVLCLKPIKALVKTMDYSEVGGAPFLGLTSLVVKAHGASNAKAIVGAVNQCRSFIEKDIVNKIQKKFKLGLDK
ncbi:MAG: phosphate acyltransferase PlsX [Clostridiales bacterium]|nr:phosphate acyltransferase PlsX [Clostridiales bacterium]